MLSGEATNTNFVVFSLTRPGLELTIYRTRGEHANHYTTDAVSIIVMLSNYKKCLKILKKTKLKEISETVNRRTDNAMANRQDTTKQTMIQKTLHNKVKIEQQNHHYNRESHSE